WNQITSGITTSNINTISIDGNRVVLGTDNGVFISNNGGTNFAFAGLAGEFISEIYVKDNYIFTYGFNGVMQSADAGLTWTAFTPLIPYSDIVDFAVSGNKVFATTSGILMMSDVFAANWTQVAFNTQVASNVNIQFNYSVCATPSGLYVASNRGVFKSSNNGVLWDEFNNNLQTQNVFGLAVGTNNGLFAGASLYGVSNYNSGNWNYSGLALYNCNHMKARGNDIYVATDFGINRTSDNGATWPLINGQGANPITGFCQRVDFKDTLILGACLQQGVLRTGDNGATWAFQNAGMPNALVSAVSICGNNIIAGTFNEGLYTSTDAGFTWNQTGAPGELINDITSIGNRVLAASATANYLSSDGGLTWTIVSNTYYEDLYAHNGLVFASSNGNVRISRDSGQTFNLIINTPGSAISLTATNDDVYIGTIDDGVWKRSISEVLGVEDQEVQNIFANMIPNIFKDQSILVSSELLIGNNSILKIMDQTGKVVQEMIVRETETTIDAQKLAPGLYHYSLTNGTKYQATGKFVVY
ncbi:MAG: T9SS type A sorting domain-containing protein, partial [Bacteroidota bacterium]